MLNLINIIKLYNLKSCSSNVQVMYFYGTGTKLIKIPHPECPHVSVSLVKTFVGRFKKIMDSSQNCRNQDLSNMCQKLDVDEKKLFEINRLSVELLDKWERRESNIIVPSNLVLQSRKRKRDQVF